MRLVRLNSKTLVQSIQWITFSHIIWSYFLIGALYKALSCFSLRDIDCSKIESRPTSASLLNFLKFKSQQAGHKARNKADLPRFRYCFYLDFLASELDENTQNALSHLREQADFLRILGSYPQKSKLVGPVATAVERLKHTHVDPNDVSLSTLPSDIDDGKPLNIGILGFGNYGQFLAKRMTKNNRVTCLDNVDKVCFWFVMIGNDIVLFYEFFINMWFHINDCFLRDSRRKQSSLELSSTLTTKCRNF